MEHKYMYLLPRIDDPKSPLMHNLVVLLSKSHSGYIMSSPSVVLILGSGPRIGAAVAKHFGGTGCLVAIASRRAVGGKTAEGYLSIKADLADPSGVPAIFEATKQQFGSAPNIVIYNAASLTPPPNNDLFSIPTTSVAADLNTNTVSVYAAAQEAVKGWKTLAEDVKKVFIYTGNKQNTIIGPLLLTATLGLGKSATSYLIGTADKQYSKFGYR
jgi:NAD(P)-dependent dehydrogenase (short-subunit alcohol dehydrogenase family)